MKFLAVLFWCVLASAACGNPKAKGDNDQPDAMIDSVLANGKNLFITKCASCHMVNKEMTGPALKNVEARWPDKQKLYAFIRNSQQVIKEDKYAHELWLTFNQTLMPEHNDLSDHDIESILRYIESVSEPANP